MQAPRHIYASASDRRDRRWRRARRRDARLGASALALISLVLAATALLLIS